MTGGREVPLAHVLRSVAGTEPRRGRNAAWEGNPETPRPSHAAEVTAGGLQRPLRGRSGDRPPFPRLLLQEVWTHLHRSEAQPALSVPSLPREAWVPGGRRLRHRGSCHHSC